MKKPAETKFPLHDLIAYRWSPRAFKPDPVSTEQLGSLFEAARWGASCFNAQPWHFVVATKADAPAYERIASCLVEGNAAWAKNAPVLGVAVAERNFQHNGKPNRWAQYDTEIFPRVLGLGAIGLGITNYVVHETSSTEFCFSCHSHEVNIRAFTNGKLFLVNYANGYHSYNNDYQHRH